VYEGDSTLKHYILGLGLFRIDPLFFGFSGLLRKKVVFFLPFFPEVGEKRIKADLFRVQL
jgi:hypothetical protein